MFTPAAPAVMTFRSSGFVFGFAAYPGDLDTESGQALQCTFSAVSKPISAAERRLARRALGDPDLLAEVAQRRRGHTASAHTSYQLMESDRIFVSVRPFSKSLRERKQIFGNIFWNSASLLSARWYRRSSACGGHPNRRPLARKRFR